MEKMELKPLALMVERVYRNGEESDTTLVTELLYLGEFITKIVTSLFVAALDANADQDQYRVLHRLVRADGIGEWVSALEELLSGPASQSLSPAVHDIRKTLTEKHGSDAWQFSAVNEISDTLKGFYSEHPSLHKKVSLLDWFRVFSMLRNKTRGHGAPTPAKCHEWSGSLQSSLETVCTNLPLDSFSWVYLHRNLSGRYRVTKLCGNTEPFESLKTPGAESAANLENGIYVWADGYRRVELCHTDGNVSDFFFPNGAFKGKTFELHSLITDNRLQGDASAYAAPATARPSSETEGLGELGVINNVFTNLPQTSDIYVARPKLEKEIRDALLNDRHPMVTLVGRGGIGKTTLALKLLREISSTDRYELIIWFSSRDIDLTPTGPKTVSPKVLTENEIATEYTRLVGIHSSIDKKKQKYIDVFSNELTKSSNGPTLFVFDNFETARNPVDMFNWIDCYIRLPNKVLITSRFRDFKADYPIEIHGMEESEARYLVEKTTKNLGVNYLSREQETDVIECANYHPYIIKILLGEIANRKAYQKPKKIMARQEEILEALFERSFLNISPLAKNVFLTLCAWRSLVPQLAVEAMIHSHGDISVDPEVVIDQLVGISLVERKFGKDRASFLEVPLSAAVFGQKKLEVTTGGFMIKADVKFLQDFGATRVSGIELGIEPRIGKFFKSIAERIAKGENVLGDYREVLEFLASQHSKTWLLTAELEFEMGLPKNQANAAACLRRFLETDPPDKDALQAWLRLEQYYRQAGNIAEACAAILKADKIEEQPYYRLSNMASALNSDTQTRAELTKDQIAAAYKPLSTLMESRLSEANAVDHSRLAWLHLHCRQEERSLEVAELGLSYDPHNVYCQRLVDKLSY